MPIFAVILKIYVNFPDFMPTSLYYIPHGLSLSSWTLLFITVTLPIRLQRVVKCGLAETWQAD